MGGCDSDQLIRWTLDNLICPKSSKCVGKDLQIFGQAHFGYYVQKIIRHPVRKENGSDSTGADGKILVNIIAHGEEMLSVGGIEYRVLMMFDDI